MFKLPVAITVVIGIKCICNLIVLYILLLCLFPFVLFFVCIIISYKPKPILLQRIV